jgi:hypothetical protein
VDFIFTNRTGSVVYLNRARLRERQSRFPVPLWAVKDIGDGWRELKFLDRSMNQLTQDECILQTNDRAVTNIAISQQMGSEFYSYRPRWMRKWFRCPKYFRLQYTAMVGNRKCSVDTIY